MTKNYFEKAKYKNHEGEFVPLSCDLELFIENYIKENLTIKVDTRETLSFTGDSKTNVTITVNLGDKEITKDNVIL